jgi:hypothetical protein
VAEVSRYWLVLRERDSSERTGDFSSLTGKVYTVGDTISLEPEGELWRVVEERPADPPFDSTLICERAK